MGFLKREIEVNVLWSNPIANTILAPWPGDDLWRESPWSSSFSAAQTAPRPGAISAMPIAKLRVEVRRSRFMSLGLMSTTNAICRAANSGTLAQGVGNSSGVGGAT